MSQRKCIIFLFADDTTLLFSNKSLHDLIDITNAELAG